MNLRALNQAVMVRLTQGGIDCAAASSLCAALGGNPSPPTPTAAARSVLAQASELYGKLFDDSGRAEWKRLTGIELGKGAPRYPEWFLPSATLLTLRADLAAHRDEIQASYRVRRYRYGNLSVSSIHVAAPETIAKLRKLEATARRRQDWCGWWKVKTPGRGWSFNKIELAARCYELLRAQGCTAVEVVTRTTHPDPGYRHMFNPRGPVYE